MPGFARSILKEKKIFIRNFLVKYMGDLIYQHEIEGWNLLFVNHKYKGLFEDFDDMAKYIGENDHSKSYLIDNYYRILGYNHRSITSKRFNIS